MIKFMFPEPYLRAIARILAVSYPLLALSAGARAAVQIWARPEIVDKFPAMLSGAAAILYLLATAAFLIRRPWAWRLSAIVLVVETFGVLVVGSSSFTNPLVIGHTVWQYFGRDYAFLPLIQPILGLVWLFDARVRRSFFR